MSGAAACACTSRLRALAACVQPAVQWSSGAAECPGHLALKIPMAWSHGGGHVVSVAFPHVLRAVSHSVSHSFGPRCATMSSVNSKAPATVRCLDGLISCFRQELFTQTICRCLLCTARRMGTVRRGCCRQTQPRLKPARSEPDAGPL